MELSVFCVAILQTFLLVTAQENYDLYEDATFPEDQTTLANYIDSDDVTAVTAEPSVPPSSSSSSSSSSPSPTSPKLTPKPLLRTTSADSPRYSPKPLERTTSDEGPSTRRTYPRNPPGFHNVRSLPAFISSDQLVAELLGKRRFYNSNHDNGKKYISSCRCSKISNCPKLQISVPRCPPEEFYCCFPK